MLVLLLMIMIVLLPQQYIISMGKKQCKHITNTYLVDISIPNNNLQKHYQQTVTKRRVASLKLQ